jgi:hypothetical protein
MARLRSMVPVTALITALATTSAPGCMTGMLYDGRKHPGRGSVIVDAGIGAVGDLLLGCGAAALHGAADDEPDTGFRDLFPYYFLPLAVVDTIAGLLLLQRIKK